MSSKNIDELCDKLNNLVISTYNEMKKDEIEIEKINNIDIIIGDIVVKTILWSLD
jgi:hypothetical protein